MWFKNCRFYTVDFSELNSVLSDPALTEEALQKAAFKPCAAQDVASIGFAPLYGHDTPFHFSSGKNYFFKLMEESKLLPSSVIKANLEELTEAKELELKRQLKKTEKEALKAAVTNELLGKAFATRREFLIWLNVETGVVGINVTSAKRAEKAVALLREAFSTFPAKLLAPRCLVDERITKWLTDNELPSQFKLGSETTLKSKDEDGGVIRASKEDLTSQEIYVHLDAGKLVTELGLNFEDNVEFTLTSEIVIKKIKPSDIYLEKNLPEKSDDAIADAEALLVIQGDILTSLTQYLMEIFDCDLA
ncbi:MAG: recombination-associated protein RdgC [Aeromonadales bacterium]|nr:recombination-associated protein RdgC [Aeromonadales bacterium]